MCKIDRETETDRKKRKQGESAAAALMENRGEMAWHTVPQHIGISLKWKSRPEAVFSPHFAL